jgi:hypothetical protein
MQQNLRGGGQASPHAAHPPIKFCKTLLTRPHEPKEMFNIKCDKKLDIKGKMRKMDMTMAYMVVLTSHSHGTPEKKHRKHIRTADFPATIQNCHFLNINCVHCCWANVLNRKALKFPKQWPFNI